MTSPENNDAYAERNRTLTAEIELALARGNRIHRCQQLGNKALLLFGYLGYGFGQPEASVLRNEANKQT